MPIMTRSNWKISDVVIWHALLLREFAGVGGQEVALQSNRRGPKPPAVMAALKANCFPVVSLPYHSAKVKDKLACLRQASFFR